MPEAARVGKYELLRLIATGGMGEVFLARPDSGPADQYVVVKRVLRHLAADKTFIQMFLNEARIAAMLSHPNVVRILALGAEDGTYFMAMEYVHGRSLHVLHQRAQTRGGMLPAWLVSSICARALRGLEYAHTYRDDKRQVAGVVHRDISPDNVLVGFDGAVKMADFGIAKALRQGDVTTRTQLLKGKLPYMAPEQLEGKSADARTDVYGMGVVLYELLTGSRPFVGATDAMLVHRVLSGDKPRPPRELNPELPAELEAVALKAIARDAGERFQSAAAMGSALGADEERDIGAYLAELFQAEALATPTDAPVPLGGTAPLVPSLPPTELASPGGMARIAARAAPPRRRGALAALGVAAVAAVAGIGWFATRHGPPPSALLETKAPAPPPVEATTSPPPAAPSPAAAPAAELAQPPRERERRVARPGKVDFRVYPWAEVFYRGKSLGVTPFAPVEAPAGMQTFVLKNKQLSQQKEVHIPVPAGGLYVYKFDFLKR